MFINFFNYFSKTKHLLYGKFIKKLLKVELSEESIQLKKVLKETDYGFLRVLLRKYKNNSIEEKTLHDYIAILIKETQNENYNK